MRLKRLARKTLTVLAVAAGLTAAATSYFANKRAAETEAAYPAVGQFVEISGGRVHYVQKGSGPHVVLLHGAGGNLNDFTFDLMDRLTDDYTVTAFDRPGLGYTDRVPNVPTGMFATEGDSPADQAVMLRAAASQIGIKSPIVVGHSFGGIVALAWALAGLDEEAAVNAAAVVSYAGVMMPWPGDLGWYYTLNGSPIGGAITIPLISAFAPSTTINNAAEAVFAPQAAPSGYAQHIGGALSVRPASFRANVRQVNTLHPKIVEMTARYPELTLPIEVLHGTEDVTVPISVHPEEFVKLVPDMVLTKLEGVGHMPHHSDAQAAIDTIHRAATRAGLR